MKFIRRMSRERLQQAKASLWRLNVGGGRRKVVDQRSLPGREPQSSVPDGDCWLVSVLEVGLRK